MKPNPSSAWLKAPQISETGALSLTPIRAVPVVEPWPNPSELAVGEPEPSGADGCAYLFQVCKALQKNYLDERNVELMFDVEPGELPISTCRALGTLIADFVVDLLQAAPQREIDGTIGVALKRRDTACVVVLSDQGFQESRQARAGSIAAAEFAAYQSGNYEVRETIGSRFVVVTFELPAMVVAS